MHELFVAGEVDVAELEPTTVRPVVAKSWQRSLAKGVDPDFDRARPAAVGSGIAKLRDSHPLAPALP